LSSDSTIDSSDARIYFATTGSIPASGTDTSTITCVVPLTILPGTYYAGLYLDATVTAATSAADVTVTGSATLTAISAVVQGAPVTVGANGTFQVTSSIQNSGTAAGSTAYSIYLSTDATITAADTLVFSGTSGAIAPTGVETVSNSCNAPSAAGGPYYAGVYIAAGNAAATAAADVTVVDAVVPVAQSITVVGAPVSVASGQTFQVTRAIRNAGTLAGTVNYTVYLSSDATIDATDFAVFVGTTASIAPGATDTLTDTCYAAPQGGPYYAGLLVSGGSSAVTAAADVTVTRAPISSRRPSRSPAPRSG